MGHVFDNNDARAWEASCEKPCNRYALDLEARLMMKMIKPMRRESLLDIGCGTGTTMLPFLEMGLDVTGIDPSNGMLHFAKRKMEHRVELHRGSGEDLPFDDNSFNYSCIIKTLEFAEDPKKVLEEACRVTKYRVFIGLINGYSPRGNGLRIKRFFTGSFYRHARFYGIWEMKGMLRELAGNTPISWKTTCQFPLFCRRFAGPIERFGPIQKSPFGAFTGITVTLFPRFRTRPLELKAKANPATTTVVAGCVGTIGRGRREEP